MRKIKKRLSILLCILLCVVFTAGCSSEEYKNDTSTKVPFSWRNATVYFALTDRFLDGDSSNNHSYGRELDANGKEYANYKQQPATFHGGDIKGLTQKIKDGYFTDLGVNAIWITSPFEQIHGWIGGVGFRHYPYHGYYALDYTSLDANVGTKEQFKEFVETAHKNGIRVVLDVVLNHAGYATLKDMDEYGFGKLNDGWKDYYYGDPKSAKGENDETFIDKSSKEAWAKWWGPQWVRSSKGYAGYTGEESGPDQEICLSGLPDFKTETENDPGIPALWKTKWTKEGRYDQEVNKLKNYFSTSGKKPTVSNYLVKEVSDWVREYGIDGFRCDTAKHVNLETWKALKEASTEALRDWKKANPDKKVDDSEFWMTGEVWDHGVQKDAYFDNGFDSLINFQFQKALVDIKDIDGIYSDYADKINSDTSFDMLSYISSHDTTLYNREDLINGGTGLLLVPGAAQIFYGDETARPLAFEDCAYEDQKLRGDMNWNSINKTVLSHWQKLGRFRRAHLAVGAGEHAKISDSPYTFSRIYKQGNIEDKVVCVIGANSKEKTEINVSTVFKDGTKVRDAYTGKTAKVKNGKVKFTSDKNGVILVEEEK
ncbi:alpha-amylase family glycosyl hydrolase [Inconstantimicrobium mannanitabidum]|uniref:Uncharacterized protein n=1 Tax=Inconstantimicrobium mannanitabidum TaxID=1604901 RepID=A0ACB5RDK0_9CLOT|nr:alpha-amylase family glycosyl hydrolase [Clostridium sp. TW13]GKX67242.1 hypothetical protein rsdtw13_25000 [Clostridium sp. TW13]